MKQTDIVFIEIPRYGGDPEENPAKVNGHLPNLGLCSLAAVAEKEGYKAAILDAAALQYSPRQIVDQIKAMRPKYVGITAMTHTIRSAAFIAGLLKKSVPDLTVILGGVHITAAPVETLLKFPDCFDVCVIGEGEGTLPELLRTLDEGGDLNAVAGLAFVKDGETVRTAPREFLRNMDSLPLPAWHLLPNMKKYYGTTLISAGGRVSNHLLTSRGCPGRCIFCDTSVNGHKLRSFSTDYVMEMIDILHKKYETNDIQFNDDTFVTLKKRMLDICNKLIAKNYKLSWSCDARASDVTEESLKIMKAAGCWQIAFGVETGSQRVMDFIQKKVTFEQIRNAFKWAKKAGISTKGFFILGHPTEDRQSINETIDLMLSLDIDVVGVTFFTVFPGSPVFPIITQYGKFDSDWDRTNTYEVGNFIPKDFTEEELIGLRKQAISRFYFRPKYMAKQLYRVRKPYDLYRLITGGIKMISRSIFNT
ncbi:MAG: radical SAM protein [Chloroflexota bacterium]